MEEERSAGQSKGVYPDASDILEGVAKGRRRVVDWLERNTVEVRKQSGWVEIRQRARVGSREPGCDVAFTHGQNGRWYLIVGGCNG